MAKSLTLFSSLDKVTCSFLVPLGDLLRLPVGGPSSLTSIIFKVQHATINDILLSDKTT